ncbi:MAG: bifunctional 2-C-methyl-D-erythritol 4-phosphate cytidylyltransferase/2-C-methyl-D-erythritol 2,4-cyclodiphosphate synthase [Hyphomicrobium sp.]
MSASSRKSAGVPGLRIAALIVAAGRGSRAVRPDDSTPKQYAMLGGAPVLWRTIQAFQAAAEITHIQVVIHQDDADLYRNCAPVGAAKLWPPVPGGPTRQASVRLGLEALAGVAPDAVLIHDAARPFIGADTIADIARSLRTHPAALAALPVSDTLKRANSNGAVAETIDREGLWRAQTPQGFHFDAILKAHRDAATAGRDDFTDDAAVAEWAGIVTTLVEGSERNAKITTTEDLAMAERLLAANDTMMESRSASGFDVHRFTAGDHVWLGGVKIPHTASLEGHSDADVALHALTDALLGSIGDGDIGQHFPPSDPQWKGAASIRFLQDAARRVWARGGRIVNVDVTILAEAPKVGPHRAAMQAAIGAALKLSTDRIGVKATTTEGLGFTGRREGIAAMATATVMLPASLGSSGA